MLLNALLLKVQTINAKNFVTIVNLTNIGYGYGLGATPTVPVPFSDNFINITNITGYKFSLSQRYKDRYGLKLRNCVFTGLGVGFANYNGGSLVPFFLDVRYWLNYNVVSPYIYGDGGLLLNFSDLNGGTRMFLNPGFGFSFALTEKLVFKTETGLFIQMGNSKPRDAFLNFNLGLAFKFL